jgi:dolichol kinase
MHPTPSDIKKKIESLELDAHWYRRVFHTFGTIFLIYYLLPDDTVNNYLKLFVPPCAILCVIIIEILRLRGIIDNNHFFGLRIYEKKRVGSYLYFGIGIVVLLMLFPQQIAIPCILCACIADPIIGETRLRYGGKASYCSGFAVCFIIFLLTWYQAKIEILLMISCIGASGALIGEVKKIWWLDDDLLIQLLPAVILLCISLIAAEFGLQILPDVLLHPI